MSEDVLKDSIVSVEIVRHYLQDYEDNNAGLDMEYLTDPDIMECIHSAIEDFNETPPMLYHKYEAHDFPYRKLLIDGAVIEGLELTVRKEQRREMQYDDGGIQSSIYYKTPAFRQLLADLKESYERQKARQKRHLNMQACYGSLK